MLWGLRKKGSAAVGIRRLAITIEADRRKDPNRSRELLPGRRWDDLRREIAQVVAKYMLLDSDEVTVREQRRGSALCFTAECPEREDDTGKSKGKTRTYGLLAQAGQ